MRSTITFSVSQPFLTPPSSLPSSLVSPFSLLPPLLLSLHSTGMKRSLEWKKYIRYPSSHHPFIPNRKPCCDYYVNKPKGNEVTTLFPRTRSHLAHLEMSPVQKEHCILALSLSVDMCALPTLCLCDILGNLCLHCKPVVMVFYFGFAVLCVFFTLYVSCDILIPAEKYEGTSQAAEGSFLSF